MRLFVIARPAGIAAAISIGAFGCSPHRVGSGPSSPLAHGSHAGGNDESCDESKPDEDSGHDTVDDGFEPTETPSPAAARNTKAPFADPSDSEIDSRLRADIGALGPISIG